MTTPTQQPDRCPRCDDPACDVPAAHEACKGINWYTESDDADRLHSRLGMATRDCAKRPAVDWRARCLAAEALAGTGGAVEPARVLDEDECFTLKWAERLVARTVAASGSPRADGLAQKFESLVGALLLAGTGASDSSGNARAEELTKALESACLIASQRNAQWARAIGENALTGEDEDDIARAERRTDNQIAHLRAVARGDQIFDEEKVR